VAGWLACSRAGVAERIVIASGVSQALRRSALPRPTRSTSLLAGEPAVEVRRWLIGPNSSAGTFHGWAHLIPRRRASGRDTAGGWVWGFALFLVAMILVGLPLTVVGTPIPMCAALARAGPPAGRPDRGSGPIHA
jgi:hypothetical protein